MTERTSSSVERRARERRARDAAERKFRRIFEESPDCISIQHWKTGRFVEVNRSFERLTGYAELDVVGRAPQELTPLFAAAGLESLVEALQKDGIARDREITLVTRAGAPITCICTVSLIELDRVRHAIMIARDVTRERRAERDLRESEEKFAKLFQLDPSASILVRLADRVILDINAAFERERGWSRADTIGRTLLDLGQWRDAERRERFYQRLAREGAVQDAEADMHVQDGSVRTVLLDGVTLELAGEKCALLVSRDITGRKQAEREMRRLNTQLGRRVADRTRELEAANRELEAFSYSVAHDLRAPLRAIIGFSELLEGEPDTAIGPAGHKLLQRIVNGSGRMSQMIDALLALSHLSRVQLSVSRVRLSDLARSIGAELAAGAPQRSVEFVVEDGMEAMGDPRLMRVLLENLLGNAWKYTSKKPAARIECGTLRATGPLRCFFVSDDGAGFDPAQAGRLFGVFQRLHGANEFPGHGVGLSTVKRIAERHGGRVWAESEPEGGATFYFELPGPA